MVRAPAPAMVVSIPVSAGDEVTAGDVVAVVESMKLETALRAPGLRAGAGDPGRRRTPRSRAARSWCGWSRTPTTPRSAVTERASLGGPRHAAGRGLRRRHRGRRRAHLAALPRARLRHRRARRPSAAGRPQRGPPGPAARRPDRARGRARHLPHLRRPLRAVAQPARTRGREPAGRPGGRGGAQPAGVPLRLPALPRRRRRGAARVVPGQAAPGARPTTACPTWSRSDALSSALYRMFLAHRRAAAHVPVLLDLLGWRLRHPDSLPDGRPRALPAGARPPGQRHPAAAPRGGRPRPARALHLLRRARDRRRAGAGPAGRARRAGPPLRRPGRAGRADRPHRRLRPSRSSGCSGGRTTP